MGQTFKRCGHSRAPENINRSGCLDRCQICMTAYYNRRRAETQVKHDQVRDLIAAGVDPDTVARRFRYTRTNVLKIYRENRLPVPAIASDPLYWQRAVGVAARIAGVEAADIFSTSRKRHIVYARWAVMTGMVKRGVSRARVGKRLGRDHATVIHGLREIAYLADRRPDIAELLAKVDAA